MLPIKLEIPDDFLSEEVREGFKVTKERKELWAVLLDLLNELLIFCRKNKIQVYAGYGTLLGAVRHKGFIPWDDDIDVMMKRDDYTKFCEIASFRKPYFLQTEKTDIGFSRDFARLRNSDTTCIQRVETDMDITYNQGVFIDIFPLDYMPNDPKERFTYGTEMRKLREKAIKWSEFTYRSPKKVGMKGKIIKTIVKKSVSVLCVPVLKRCGMKNPYIKRMESESKRYKRTNRIGHLWFYEPDRDLYCWNTSEFMDIDVCDFEMLKIPIPRGFDKVLTNCFGEWRIPVMQNNDHGDLIVDCHIPYEKYKY